MVSLQVFDRQLVPETAWNEILSGRTVTTSHPGWHSRATLLAMVFSFAASISSFTLLVFYTATVGFDGKSVGVTDWLIILASSTLFAWFGFAFAVALSSHRSHYQISDRELRQTFSNGKARSFALNDITAVHSRWWNNADVAVSSDGTKIRFSDGVPEYLAMRTFCHAAAGLNKLGAEGNRLFDLFASTLHTRGSITFQADRFIAATVLGVAGLIFFGAISLKLSLFPKEPLAIWWQIGGVLLGTLLLAAAAFAVWREVTSRREAIVLYTDRIEHLDKTGHSHTVRWEELSEVRYPVPECSAVCFVAADGRERIVISVEFRELYAIAYFAEHMRAREPR